jgi:hypothetical protein
MKLLIGAVLLFCSFLCIGQSTFTAAAPGNWSAPGTWSCSGDCLTTTPTSTDDVFTNGFSVNVDVNASCKNLFVEFNIANSITFGSALRTLTITGTLVAWDSGSSLEEFPTADVISDIGRLSFTGVNVDVYSPYIIYAWDPTVSDLGQTTFTLGSGNSFNLFSPISFNGASANKTVTISSGTLLPDPGAYIEAKNGGSTGVSLTINAGATLSTSDYIAGPTTTSGFSTITVNGTLTTSSYVNATTLNIGSAGVLNSSFFGANQTEGWWYQSARPTGGTLNAASTVNFNGSTDQSVYARDYGHLTLSSSGTKTVAGSGTLTINGNLTINSSSVTLNSDASSSINIGGNLNSEGTWSPADAVNFNGTGSQSILGSGTVTFGNGLLVNKSAGILTFNKNLSVSNGITISAGTLSLGDAITTLASGNVTNSGTITSGTSGSLLVSSTSTFNSTGSYTLNHLTVSGSGNASFGTSVAFTGNIVNNGSLSFSSTITVSFTGSSTQTISGSAFSITNMLVNKSATTLQNNGNVTLLGNLTMTTGTFDADGTGSGVFILNSDTNGDATIGNMAGGSITGSITFKRYFNNTANRWRNIGFPVTGITTTSLASSFQLNANSIGWYNESTGGNADQGWFTISGSLPSKRGYSAYMYSLAPTTISVTGPLLVSEPAQSGSPYDFAVTYTDDISQPATEDGWNFVANPFACPIDWNAGSGWTKTRVNAAAAIWNSTNFVYEYSNVTWNGVVAQGQALWIQTNAASPILQCTEAVKNSSVTDPTFYRKKSTENRLLITLQNNLYKDKAVIQFLESAKLEFDPEYDAVKLKNPIFNLSTLSPEGQSFAANIMPKSFCAGSVRLNVTNIDPGAYQLYFEGVSTFQDVKYITIRDQYLNKETILSDGDVYDFQVTDEPSSYGSQRFYLKFQFNNNLPEISENNGTLISNYPSNNQWFLDGHPIQGASGKTFITSSSGTYQVQVSNGKCTVASNTVTLETPVSRVYPNPVSNFVKIDLTGCQEIKGQIEIYSMSGALVKQSSFNEKGRIKLLEIKDLIPGEYLVKVFGDNSTVVLTDRLTIQ